MNFRSRAVIENRELLFYIGIILSLLITLFLVIIYSSWGDVDNYWGMIDKLYSQGLIPYRDYVLEYPPFTVIIFLIPRIFSWDLGSFHYTYAIFCAIAYFIAARYTLKMVEDERMKLFVAIILILIPLFACKFILTRNDIFAVAGMVLAIYLFKKDRNILAYLIIALAIMIKMYPIVVLLGFFAYYLSRKDIKSALGSIMVPAVFCLLVQLPFLIIDSASAFDYLSYHSDRNIQIESVVATFMYIAYYMGMTDLHYDTTSQSENIVGALPDLVAPYMNYLLVAAMLIFFIYAFIRCRKCRMKDNKLELFIIMSTIFILIFIVFNKVYSAQYMLWILGMMPAMIWAIKDKMLRIRAFIYTLIFGFLSWFAAYRYNGMDYLLTEFTVPEELKNIMTIILLIFCLYVFRLETSTDDS